MTYEEFSKKNKNYKGSDLSNEFKSFFRKEKNRITKILTARGCKDFAFSMGFNYFFAFFTDSNGQIWYISCSDVRHFDYTKLLYRTATKYADYTGGSNNYCNIDLSDMRLH